MSNLCEIEKKNRFIYYNEIRLGNIFLFRMAMIAFFFFFRLLLWSRLFIG